MLYHCINVIDLTKAFDVIVHSILIRKLSHYGIRGTALKLISDYLSNRKQLTCVNLKLLIVECLRDQFLAPLIFNLY